MMPKVWVVYVLRDPRDMSIRWIGSTSSESGRRASHRQAGNMMFRPSAIELWRKRLHRDGLRPEFTVIARFDCEADAKACERKLIEVLGRLLGGSLLNRQWHPNFASRKVRNLPYRTFVFHRDGEPPNPAARVRDSRTLLRWSRHMIRRLTDRDIAMCSDRC